MPNHLHVSGTDGRRAACGGLSVRHARLGVGTERASFSAVIPGRLPAELAEAQGHFLCCGRLQMVIPQHLQVNIKGQPRNLPIDSHGVAWGSGRCCALLYVASLSPTYAYNIPLVKTSFVSSCVKTVCGFRPSRAAAARCNQMDLPPSGSDSAPQWPRAGNSKSIPPRYLPSWVVRYTTTGTRLAGNKPRARRPPRVSTGQCLFQKLDLAVASLAVHPELGMLAFPCLLCLPR